MVNDTRFRKGYFPANEEKGAEQAKTQLRRGIARSKAVVADYRGRLMKLRKAEDRPSTERPLFRFGRD
jgi:hypothetical protein